MLPAFSPKPIEGFIEETIVIGDREIKLTRLRNPETQTLVSKQCDLWAFVWTAGSVLADIAASLPVHEGSPLVSVEIGCGSGLASLAAARAGGHAIATDLVPDALKLLGDNGLRNGILVCNHAAVHVCSGALCTQLVDWNRADAATILRAQCPAAAQPRVVMGADVLFAGSHVRPVLRLISGVLSGAHPSAADPPISIIVDPGRFSCDDFEALAPDSGLRVLLRADIPHLPTPIACMKLCTVFLLAREDACIATMQAVGRGTAGHSWPLLASATAAVRRLEARAAAFHAIDPSPRFGYTLPSDPAALCKAEGVVVRVSPALAAAGAASRTAAPVATHE